MQGNIYLVGLMGAGKTTIGRKLAKRLHLAFIDTDQLLEQQTGVTISHIFEIEGEAGFRKRESSLFKEISGGAAAVISTGGGIILDPENRKLMRKHGQVVYLRATFDVLWGRLKGCKTRPLLQTDDPVRKIKELLEKRDPLYSNEADYIVDVTSDSAVNTAEKIYKLILPN